MRTVLEHAWHLLLPREQSVLRQLAVFHAGFRHEAAAAVANASLPLLADLVDKSWLRVSDGRFVMHELVRQFTAGGLEHQGRQQVADARASLSHYYGIFLHQREASLHSSQQLVVLREILAEIENVRSGWRWAVEHSRADLIGHYLKTFQ